MIMYKIGLTLSVVFLLISLGVLLLLLFLLDDIDEPLQVGDTCIVTGKSFAVHNSVWLPKGQIVKIEHISNDTAYVRISKWGLSHGLENISIKKLERYTA